MTNGSIAALTTLRPGWTLGDVTFMIISNNTTTGRAVFDTGASHTVVTEDFVRKAGLLLVPIPSTRRAPTLRTAAGDSFTPTATCTLNLTFQLMLDVSDDGAPPVYVHWGGFPIGHPIMYAMKSGL